MSITSPGLQGGVDSRERASALVIREEWGAMNDGK